MKAGDEDEELELQSFPDLADLVVRIGFKRDAPETLEARRQREGSGENFSLEQSVEPGRRRIDRRFQTRHVLHCAIGIDEADDDVTIAIECSYDPDELRCRIAARLDR
mgnify:CR=1 FL=1